MNWCFEAWKKFAVFEGRARRKEYWAFALFNLVAAVLLGIVDGMTGTFDPQTGVGLLSGLYGLAALVPGIAVTVRRLHDIGRSGWWILIAFVPLAGAIVLLVFAVLDSQPGGNQYGPNPKGELGPGTPVTFERPT